MKKKLTYSDSGVDIDRGNIFVKKIGGLVKDTFTNNVLQPIGGFAGLFDVSFLKGYDEPVLVSGTDGVGTKLKIAIESDKLDTIGIDLVAMCVNDVVVTGAKPLFFLDYIATSYLDPDKMVDVVKGIAKGCKISDVALIGGETAEMPGMYERDDFDVAGFCVGVVDKKEIIDGSTIRPSDVVIGIKSNGFHSNGYSLLRKIFFEILKMDLNDIIYDNESVKDVLLKPTKIYVKDVLKLLSEGLDLKGIVHITGGGFYENIPRVLPEGVSCVIDKNSIVELPEYRFIKENVDIEESELYRVFNMGIGLVLIVDRNEQNEILNILNEKEDNAFIIGRVEEGKEKVKIVGVDF